MVLLRAQYGVGTRNLRSDVIMRDLYKMTGWREIEKKRERQTLSRICVNVVLVQ